MAVLSSTNKILIDFNGNRAYLADEALLTHDTAAGDTFIASVLMNTSDLGEPSVDKLVNYIDIDYIGTFTLSITLDGTNVYSPTILDNATRDTKWLYIPLANRKPFQKIKLAISSTDEDCKIYGIEVDFDVLRRKQL